jgi:hypothetical protein
VSVTAQGTGNAARRHRRTLALVVLLVGVFYLAVIGLRIRHYGGNISSLIDAGQKVVLHEPGALGHHIVVFRNSTGYDGLAYYDVAADPFLRRPVIRDPFRYQRIGYPLAVWAVSLGQRAWRPVAMAVVNIAAVLGVAYLSGLILLQLGGGTSPWWALASAINPMLITGDEYDLAEPLVTAISLLALLLYLRQRFVAATLALAVALLTREVAILFLLPSMFAELGARRLRRTASLALSVVPYVIWEAVLARAFGRTGTSTSTGNLDLPFVGISAMLQEARHSSLRAALIHQGSIIAVLIFIIAALIIAAVAIRKRYDVLVGGVIVHAIAALFGGTAIWVAYASAARVFGGIYPFTVFAFARRRTPAFAALVVGGILIALFTFLRLVVINPALPYYITP